ncbi:coxsackievirus and adenovirus receptor homolog [Oreochromis aureus]|uniref:coxsackievirus and adenovirus receptor homolog n=1 Tax=Oreochromis aureus TaxID=47969 RepID=UPI001952C95C|nr:coxsackievirus and adenovirus receptor homolog [Oreochromis aureus]
MTTAGTASLCCCWTLLCMCLHMVCAAEVKITIRVGQTVILPCQTPINKSDPMIVLEWSRPELGTEYVLFYRDKNFDFDNQHPSFKNRVDLQDRQMKDGDVSLILKDVMINDTGTYECRVVRGRTNRRKRSNLDGDPISIIYLIVNPPGQPRGSVRLRISLIASSVLVAAVVGFLIYRKHEQSQDSERPPTELQTFSNVSELFSDEVSCR